MLVQDRPLQPLDESVRPRVARAGSRVPYVQLTARPVKLSLELASAVGQCLYLQPASAVSTATTCFKKETDHSALRATTTLTMAYELEAPPRLWQQNHLVPDSTLTLGTSDGLMIQSLGSRGTTSLSTD